jgi:hypothetical protein
VANILIKMRYSNVQTNINPYRHSSHIPYNSPFRKVIQKCILKRYVSCKPM